VLLVGLVTKNSILLVEFANQRRAQGANARDAMLQAGEVRLRPILMTSFTLILGILPIAIGFGAGAESRRPMGVAILGGMLSSTFLTLLVIPVVYTLFSDLARHTRRVFVRTPVSAGPSHPAPHVDAIPHT
jgi:multidrug efflux pump subunit AcrB